MSGELAVGESHVAPGSLPPPEVSVVVPTEGRLELLARLLESLGEARAAVPGGVEVLVVDSSADAGAVTSLCEEFEAEYIRGPTSVRAKRNLGAELARGQYLHFIDSDCWVRPDTIVEILAVARSPRAAGAVGRTEMAGTTTVATRAAEASPFLDAFDFASSMEEVPWATMTNCMVSRAAFHAVIGFDDELPFRLGGDDLDFTWRLNLSGHLLLAAPRSLVLHGRETWSTYGSVLRRVWRWGRVEAHLRVKHPAHVRQVAPSLPLWILVAGLALGITVLTAPRLARSVGMVLAVLMVGFLWDEVRTQLRRSAGAVWALPAVWLLLLVYWGGRWREGVRTRCRPLSRIYFDSPHLKESHLVFDARAQGESVWCLVFALLVAGLVR